MEAFSSMTLSARQSWIWCRINRLIFMNTEALSSVKKQGLSRRSRTSILHGGWRVCQKKGWKSETKFDRLKKVENWTWNQAKMDISKRRPNNTHKSKFNTFWQFSTLFLITMNLDINSEDFFSFFHKKVQNRYQNHFPTPVFPQPQLIRVMCRNKLFLASNLTLNGMILDSSIDKLAASIDEIKSDCNSNAECIGYRVSGIKGMGEKLWANASVNYSSF